MSIQELDDVKLNFVKTLGADVKSLVRLHNRDSRKGAGRPGEWLEAMRRAVVVLLAANLENYIETLRCQGFQYLCNKKVRARKYPENFRLWNFAQDIKMHGLGATKSRDVVDLAMRLWNDVRELQEDELKLGQLKERFANPTPKNVDWIMELLDYKDYLNGVTLKVNGKDTKAKDALSEIAERRNCIAHGDTSQLPSKEDVERLVKFSQLFGNRIHKDVEAKVRECLK